MANNNSSRKRIRTTKRNNLQNNIYKSRIKTFIKKYLNLVNNYKYSKTDAGLIEIKNSLQLTFSQLDKAGKKNIYHKNKIARQKSNLQKILNQIL